MKAICLVLTLMALVLGHQSRLSACNPASSSGSSNEITITTNEIPNHNAATASGSSHDTAQPPGSNLNLLGKFDILAVVRAAKALSARQGQSSASAPPPARTNAAAGGGSPLDDLHRIAGALLDSVLDHKAQIITSLVNLINWLMGGLLTEVRDFVDKILGHQHLVSGSSGFASRRDEQSFGDLDAGDRPITYGDIETVLGLVHDTYDVYRTWQDSK